MGTGLIVRRKLDALFSIIAMELGTLLKSTRCSSI